MKTDDENWVIFVHTIQKCMNIDKVKFLSTKATRGVLNYQTKRTKFVNPVAIINYEHTLPNSYRAQRQDSFSIGMKSFLNVNFQS